MALLKCPECSGKVSDQATACPHCGYPMNTKYISINNSYDLKLQNAVSKVQVIKMVSKFTGLSLEKAKQAVDAPERIIMSNMSFDQAINYKDAFAKEKIDVDIIPHIEENTPVTVKPKQINKPTCPRCCSTSITTGARGVDGFWGFFGASRTVNRCANCGHSWEPRG